MSEPLSLIDFLAALKTALTPLVPGVPILDRPIDMDNPIVPSISIFPLNLREKSDYAGQRGQRNGAEESEQNLYGYVYLHAPGDVVGETKAQAVTDMYRTVDALRAAFRRKSVSLLVDPQHNPQAIQVGSLYEATFDPQGPYVRYLDQLFVGCYGRISAIELMADEVYDA
jgi:hypothetical protein